MHRLVWIYSVCIFSKLCFNNTRFIVHSFAIDLMSFHNRLIFQNISNHHNYATLPILPLPYTLAIMPSVPVSANATL